MVGTTVMRVGLGFVLPRGKLARLNETLVIGEHETDAADNTRTRMWEWK